MRLRSVCDERCERTARAKLIREGEMNSSTTLVAAKRGAA